jgi:4-hydroxy-tetrahydrodipicolinate synthase
LAGGVHGLFLLGTTGEAPHLSHSVRQEVIQLACRVVNGRRPILVGISDTAIAESVSLAQFASDCGADGVIAAPPYYFPISQDELADYMRRLAAEVPLPMFLYNMPRMTKVEFSAETLRRLISIPRIVGLKDSAGDFDAFSNLLAACRERPDWSVFMGPEQLLCAAVTIGADGGISGGANVHPRLFVEAYEAAKRRDVQAVGDYEQRIKQLGRLYQFTPSATGVIQGLKSALSILGLCDDTMSTPFKPLEGANARQVRQILAESGLQPAASS